ncbi:hypothetical protein CWC31_17480 [Pseudoalteromonas ruthenica]|uniref:hypothetical protein n=1 Tax=Pseudoalteromonas ruthenica TaxID=151081 RepID=UPI00110992A7|nr:hypothetical protein [Pseudoalteromonas ruthenica]TLX49277.1 hypothetical protein CWC31_17480 [Pseudoalteromonas ruthenica]
MKLKHSLLISAITLALAACGSSPDNDEKPLDKTPDGLTFPTADGAPLNEWVESEPVSIKGIEESVSVSIENGEYSIDGGEYTTANGTIAAGETLQVRVKTPTSRTTLVEATVTVGESVVSFKAKTASQIAFMGWDVNFGNEPRISNLAMNNASLVVDVNTLEADALEGEKIKSLVKTSDELFFCRGDVGANYSDTLYVYNYVTENTSHLGTLSALTKEDSQCIEQFELENRLYVITENATEERYLWEIDRNKEGKLTKVRSYPKNEVQKDYGTGTNDTFEVVRYGKLLLKIANINMGSYIATRYTVESLLESDRPAQNFRTHEFLGEKEGLIYFRSSNQYWRTDGTESGTFEISEEQYDVLFNRENEDYYVDQGSFLCRTDKVDFYSVEQFPNHDFYSYDRETGANERLLTQVKEDSVKCNDDYAVVIQPVDNGEYLWRSGGVAENTFTLKEAASGDLEIFQTINTFYIRHDSDLYFISESGEHADQVAVQQTIKDVFVQDNTLFYNGYTDTEGTELWAANGLDISQLTADSFAPSSTTGTQSFDYQSTALLGDHTMIALDNESVYAIDMNANGDVYKFNVNGDEQSTFQRKSISFTNEITKTQKYGYFESWVDTSMGAKEFQYYRTDGVETELVGDATFITSSIAAISDTFLKLDSRGGDFNLYDDSKPLSEFVSGQVPQVTSGEEFQRSINDIIGTTNDFFYVRKKLLIDIGNEAAGGEQHLYRIGTDGSVESIYSEENLAFGEVRFLLSGDGSAYFLNPSESVNEVLVYKEESNSTEVLFSLDGSFNADDLLFYEVDSQVYMLVSGGSDSAGLYTFSSQDETLTRISEQGLLLGMVANDENIYVLGESGIWLLENDSLQLLIDESVIPDSNFIVTSNANTAVVDNKLLFEANHKLWISDGTLEGTQMLNDNYVVNSSIHTLR